jgi:hypothetical protein
MTYIKTEFEEKLKNLGFSYKCNMDGEYILSQNNDTNHILTVQLIYSEPDEDVIQLSNNGNKVEAVGSFKLKLPNKVKEPSFLILAFQNTSSHSIEYIIISKRELMMRLNKEKRISTDKKGIEIEFWLMPDKGLYDCTNLGIEGEWFYMSNGLKGRLADETEWCYTKFLNGWDGLKMI